MNMRQYAQRISVAALLILGATACNLTNDNKPDNDHPVVDSNFKITLSDVPNYDANDSISDQYLAVVNYLRSLSVTCNDAQHLSGPADVDLVWSTQLTSAAREHSEDMAKHDFYAHEGSGTEDDITGWHASPHKKSTSQERILYNGFSGMVTAENIAQTWKKNEAPPTNAWVEKMENWMKSDRGSCSIIMNPAFTDFGMYESRAPEDSDHKFKVYWTQTFGG